MANNVYDPEKDENYRAADQRARDAYANKPAYSNPYEDDTQSLYTQIQNRPSFSYDVNADALYQQYRDQYRRQGRLAMEDTLGTAQTMTGGYGNSYAQTAGQQTYQNYLGQLNDKLPELYNQALERYRMEGDDLYGRYNAALGQEGRVYDRYQDEVEAYRYDVNYLTGEADKAYDRGYGASEQASRASDSAYDRLKYMISQGYVPTEEEMVAAGFTTRQAGKFK